jgi:hypothetical protein
MSRAILESMKNAHTGDITTEDEVLARAVEESMRAPNQAHPGPQKAGVGR